MRYFIEDQEVTEREFARHTQLQVVLTGNLWVLYRLVNAKLELVAMPARLQEYTDPKHPTHNTEADSLG